MKYQLEIAALAYVLFLSACAGKSEALNTTPSIPVVPAAKVAYADLSNDVVLTAEFLPYQEVDVMAKVAGFVRTIPVDIGDRVNEGAVLATLEVPEMQDEMNKGAAAVEAAESEVQSARDELQRAMSAHDIAHVSFTRIQDVAKKEKGLVPQQEVDEIHSRDLQAEAQVSVAKSGLTSAQRRSDFARAERARLKTMFKYTAITAPFQGVVTKRYASVGSMIQSGTASQTQAMPVVRLSQNNLLRLILPVPESAAPSIRIGESVDVNVPSLHRQFPGRVTRFTNELSTSTRTMDTEVDVPNPALTLIPGMYASVTLRLRQRNHTLSVPLDGVETTGTSRAYVVQPSGTIHIVPVSVGIETAQRVEILSGLAEGEIVITGRHAGLRDGQKVQARQQAN
jgi:RND family efflux transporter MFP subunit